MTKTKIALAAVLLFGAASAASAEDGFDPNLSNRYPGYATAGASAPSALQSAPVRLRQDRNFAVPGNYGATSEFNVDRNDRASSPYAGGGY